MNEYSYYLANGLTVIKNVIDCTLVFPFHLELYDKAYNSMHIYLTRMINVLAQDS